MLSARDQSLIADFGGFMYALKRLALAASVAGILFAAAANADDVSDDGLDDEPTCPYGYYDYAPYACAPYGYYGS